jgi:hypothetical protein
MAGLDNPIAVDADNTFISDTRIRFRLDTIIFHYDNNGWANNSNGILNNNSHTNPFVIDNFSYLKDKALNLFFVARTSGDNYVGSGPIGSVIMAGDFPQPSFPLNFPLNLLVHEFGHAAGNLRHTHIPNSGCPASNLAFNDDGLTDTYSPDIGINEVITANPGDIVLCGTGSSQFSTINTNNMMGYNRDQSHLSPLQIGLYHRNLLTYMNRLTCADSLTPTYVEQNETWNTARIVTGDVTVQSGVTLTILCKVGFPPSTKLIVEQGGKLIIDGGHLLSSCGEAWQGIEVWGNPNQPQSTAYQGKVELINGAIIENARIAIYQGGDDCCSKSGGIIQATNSTFRNNRKDVAFMQYTHANSVSYFYNCTFETTQPMNSLDYTDNHNRRLGTNQHVSIWGQKGVRFYDCQFTTVEDYTFNGVNGHFDKDIRSSGITTVDADFQVFSSDIEDEDNRTEFNNQKFGISALKTLGGLRSFKISKALFDNCQYGIRSELATNDFIDNNRFLVQDDQEHGDGYYHVDGNLNSRYGLYEVNSIRYDISNNSFTSKSGGGSGIINTFGAVLRGQATWETGFGDVNNNTFENLRRATQTEYHNWWTQLRCNNYNNGIDQEWLINPQSTWGSLNDQGTSCQVPFGIRAGNNYLNPTNAIRDRSEFPWTYWGSGTLNSTTVPSMISDNGSTSIGCNIPDDFPCEIEEGGGDFQLVMMEM